ncbi:D-glycero-alpha-D-manno-heptose-1,7-bisphosphate 7-phosphatase [Lichenihabitans psoromatis]|uniref:D-glycero-alpha-D-manno-heptose-1,7-bisphosphate 7-phosphatase n=1 Tax=Lichenihabitans psoromatis TaxID=2528642 RepID=UPI001035C3F8|nr:HAD family hydrolase [Lichenihabitans psoromatis]
MIARHAVLVIDGAGRPWIDLLVEVLGRPLLDFVILNYAGLGFRSVTLVAPLGYPGLDRWTASRIGDADVTTVTYAGEGPLAFVGRLGAPVRGPILLARADKLVDGLERFIAHPQPAGAPGRVLAGADPIVWLLDAEVLWSCLADAGPDWTAALKRIGLVPWFDHGSVLDLGGPGLQGPAALARRFHRPAVFLDRDGVINIDRGYTFRVEDLAFTPTALDGIRVLNRAGRRVIVVTNQAGVARGYYGLADVDRFHDAIQDKLMAGGAHIDAFYSSPYHPEGIVEAFRQRHEDRKPGAGMLLRAMRDWSIDAHGSVLIGDKDSDMEAAARAGIPGVLVPSDTCDLLAAAQRILGNLAL